MGKADRFLLIMRSVGGIFISMSDIRVRFAPSPTGMLHIGGARTALFNWLYARHAGGRFILRIEDTDRARSTEEAVAIILDGLRWLGLDWDEGPGAGGSHGPYFQSQRMPIYSKYVERLLSSGAAFEDGGAVRFKLPGAPCVVPDLICGNVRFDQMPEPDIVILRSDGSPVFHLVNVVDDIEMGVTHVIRGEDHLSNTPKHIALFNALGAPTPKYAHIPLILNPDGSKMSKRDEGASIGEYMKSGFVAAAVRNYICLLGWSPKDDREIMPIEDIVRSFELGNINRANARFDLRKLVWMNGQYLRSLSPASIRELARPLLSAAGLVDGHSDACYIESVIGLFREKLQRADELPSRSAYFFKDDYAVEPEAATRLADPKNRENIALLIPVLERLADFSAASIEAAFRDLAAKSGQKAAAFIHPSRAAVSGSTAGPSLFHMLEVLGKDRVLNRLRSVRS